MSLVYHEDLIISATQGTLKLNFSSIKDQEKQNCIELCNYPYKYKLSTCPKLKHKWKNGVLNYSLISQIKAKMQKHMLIKRKKEREICCMLCVYPSICRITGSASSSAGS